MRHASLHGRTSRVAAIALLAAFATAALAATPAGTLIRNQATGSFVDGDGRRITVTSNIVETFVEQVAGLSLTDDVTQRVAPGAFVELPHRIVNTGNGEDAYTLQVINLGGDNIDLSDVELYPDLDGDGRADAGAPIVSTPLLAAGEGIDLVIRARVPASATDGSVARLQLEATSGVNPALFETNTDTVTAGSDADIALTKSIDGGAGRAPSGPHRVTLRYENLGADAAGDLVLIDALPAGMDYVPGSARWSGSAAALSDADPADVQSGNGASIRFCAYDASCTALPEASLDANAVSTDQVTAIIDFVPAGAVGTLAFDITIASGTPPGDLVNQAEFEYDVAVDTVARALGNPAAFRVLANQGVIANGSATSPIQSMAEPVQRGSAAAGATITFDNWIWNTGSATDSFTMEVDGAGSTFPAGTLWRLLRTDGATPLLDTNGDGLVDTGPIAPGAATRVVLELTLPADAAGDNGGLGFDIEKTARSITDPAVFDGVVDHLGSIVAATVDLTNNAPAGSAGALGGGAGPEANPVTTRALDANREARFDLHVAHFGDVPTRYALTARQPDGQPLPPDWDVRFETPAGDPFVLSGALVDGTSQAIVAIVTAPAEASAGSRSVHFVARSEDGSLSDVKHDAVLVGSDATLMLEPGGNAQGEPGGTVVYAHRLSNVGNVTVDDIALSAGESIGGWQSIVWDDIDQDGLLGPADVQLTAPISIDAGAVRFLLVQVFVPGGAPIGAENTTTLMATATTADATVVDRTRVARTQVVIVKRQAADVGCDGVPDPGTDFMTGGLEIEPGDNCVIYRLTATNNGAQPSYNVAILDYTPPWTVYEPAASCSRTPCSLTEPAPGEAGALNAATDALAPGESYSLEFSVRVR